MKKFTFLFIVFLSTFSQVLEAEVIKKIIINNNERISLGTIKTYGDIEIGKDYSDVDLNQVIKNLYNTNFFSKINMKIDNNILIIDVIENKLIQSISIKGIKSEKLTKAIMGNLFSKNKSAFVKSEVEKDLGRIKSSLTFQGYYFSNVTSSIIENTNNTIKLIFNIDTGEKSKISKIVFTGDKIFNDRALRNLITLEEAKFWKFLSSNKFFNKKSIQRDERLLKQFYLNEGYYDVVINTSTATLVDNSRFRITFNIDAGNLYTIENTYLKLPIDYDSKNFENVKFFMDELKNEIYSFSKISKVVKAIDKISLSREYDFINADILEEKVSDNKINITFTVSESESLYVERINVLGNNITEESVIRNSLEVDEGDPFNELLHAKSLNQLRSKGIFASVESEILPGSNSASKIINIEVEEKPTGEISLGAGVGTTGGTLGFSVSENNFIGKGIRLSTSLRLSGDAIRGNFTINNPNYNYSGRSLVTNIESVKIDKLDKSGYESTRSGFSLGTRFEKNENLFFSPRIKTNYEKISTNPTASAALKKQEGTYFENKFSYSFDYDTRNQRYQTSDGFRSIFEQGIPIISDDYALMNSYSFTKWHKFENKMVTDLSFYGKIIGSIKEGENVRVSNRLDLGANKLRGFKAGKVGPVDNSDFVGGNNAVAINFNTTLPMIFPSLEKIDFKYFIDVANVWGVDYSSSVDQSNSIRSSTGVTVDWFTPIGPMNFSFSQNISKATSDQTENFQFNLGTTF